ncbi:MAG TPA: GcrA family cell cycle regulator, partial [Caulobacteraceae bacterium]
MARRTPAKDKPSSHGWTPKRVAILQKLWLDGLSAGQIAKLLGGTTRN